MNKYVIAIATIIAIILLSTNLLGEKAMVNSEQDVLFSDDFSSGLDPLWTQNGSCTWSAADGNANASLSGCDLACYILAQDTTWEDYTFEYDVRGNAGVDKAVIFRFNANGGYAFSIRSDWITGDEAFLHVPGINYAQIVPFPSQNGVWYHVEINCQGNHIIIKVDGTKIIDYVDVTNSCPAGGVILHCGTGMACACDVSFDNVVVKAIYSGPTWHVATNGDDVLGNGSSAGPFATIQKGIDASESGDTVLVGPGTYVQTIDYIGKAVVVKSELGSDSTTILSSVPTSGVVTFDSGEDTLAIIDGFRFENLGSEDRSDIIKLVGSSATIRNCVFANSSNCASITQLQGGYLIAEDNNFVGSGSYFSVGIHVSNGQGRVSRCEFRNMVNYTGGAAIQLSVNSSNYIIEDCLFLHNQTFGQTYASGGAGVFLSETVGTVVRNNTFVENTDVANDGGAIGIWYYCSGISIHNNIFSGNNGYAVANQHESSVIFDCNNAFGNYPADYVGAILPGPSSISFDPMFCDSEIDNYQIWETSPCAPANNSCGVLIGAYGIGCANAAPLQFDLLNPPNMFMPPIATRTPTLEWNAAIDTDPLDQVTYTLHLALDSNFLFAIVVPNISSESYLIEQPLNWSSRFWWKVKAVDLHGGETWSSETFRFRTMALGDADGSGAVTIVDVVYLVNFIFTGGPAPQPIEAGDPNCDGRYNITDLVYLINFIFAGGPAPCEG